MFVSAPITSKRREFRLSSILVLRKGARMAPGASNPNQRSLGVDAQ